MNKEDRRKAVLELYLSNNSIRQIAATLKIPITTAFNDIKRFNEQGDFNDRKHLRIATVRTRSLKDKVRLRYKRERRRSARKVAKELNINRETIRKVLKYDLGLTPYKMKKRQDLNEKKRKVRLERTKCLLQSDAIKNLNSILFTDEKIFTIEQSFNSQNDRIWAESSPGEDVIVTRIQKPVSIMVWGGISATSKTPLLFLEKGVKMNQNTYREILENSVLPWAKTTYSNHDWIFQQDSAPSHTAKLIQKWLFENFPNFITPEEWPPYSPDLNPMDYSVWGILEQKACSTRHSNLGSLKKALQTAWEEIDSELLRRIVAQFPKRLMACVKAKGGYIE